jgi:hypothetical protein
LIIAIIAGVGVPICGLTAASVGFEMVDKVNMLLPTERQFAPLGWYYSKYKRLNYEYRRLYPDGNLLRRYCALTLLMFACLLVSCWGFGLFSR